MLKSLATRSLKNTWNSHNLYLCLRHYYSYGRIQKIMSPTIKQISSDYNHMILGNPLIVDHSVDGMFDFVVNQFVITLYRILYKFNTYITTKYSGGFSPFLLMVLEPFGFTSFDPMASSTSSSTLSFNTIVHLLTIKLSSSNYLL